jgi:hypothetical protein
MKETLDLMFAERFHPGISDVGSPPAPAAVIP